MLTNDHSNKPFIKVSTVIGSSHSDALANVEIDMAAPCTHQHHPLKQKKINEPMIMIIKVVSDQITVLRESWYVKYKMGVTK